MQTHDFKLKVHDESELFTTMDPDQNMLSDDVISYLTRLFIIKHRKIREDYTITIVSDEPVNEEHVREAFRNEAETQKEEVKYGLRRLKYKLIAFAILGVLILSVWIFFAMRYETVMVEILSIMGWVCIWEATSIGVIERPELKRERLNFNRLSKAEIKFQVTGKAEEEEK